MPEDIAAVIDHPPVRDVTGESKKDMFKSYEIDYYGRTYLLGSSRTIKEACELERVALRKNNREFPTFTENGRDQVTNNGKMLYKSRR